MEGWVNGWVERRRWVGREKEMGGNLLSETTLPKRITANEFEL